MANYPSSLVLCDNNAVILEDVPNPSLQLNPVIPVAFGYVRQLGISVNNCALDNNVCYKTGGAIQFNQAGINFIYISSKDILFINNYVAP